jgi:hypothetical protein
MEAEMTLFLNSTSIRYNNLNVFIVLDSKILEICRKEMKRK